MEKFYDNISIYKILSSSEFGVWIWECETDVLFFNKPYMDMLGYPHNKFPFHINTWIQLIHPDDRDNLVDYQRSVLSDSQYGDSFENKFRMLNANGEYTWVLGRGFILCRDESGKAIRVCGMHLDINMLDKMSADIDLQHDRMQFALEAANDGLWDWNPKTNEVYFSPRYLSMLGYTAKEFPPKLESWIPKIHPDDLSITVERQREIVLSPQHGDVFECVYRFMNGSGQYKWILGRGKVTKRDETGHATRVVGLHTDVTELRNAQEALVSLLNQDSLTHLYSRFYFDSVLNKISAEDYPLGIIFCDLDGLKMVNDLLGHTDGDALLTKAASIIRACLPKTAVAARLGGDEFAILLYNSNKKNTDFIAQAIQDKIDEHNYNTSAIPVLVSIGIATSKTNIPIYKLLSKADEQMLQNKNQQRHAKRYLLISRIEKKLGRKIEFLDNRLPTDNK